MRRYRGGRSDAAQSQEGTWKSRNHPRRVPTAPAGAKPSARPGRPALVCRCPTSRAESASTKCWTRRASRRSSATPTRSSPKSASSIATTRKHWRSGKPPAPTWTACACAVRPRCAAASSRRARRATSCSTRAIRHAACRSAASTRCSRRPTAPRSCAISTRAAVTRPSRTSAISSSSRTWHRRCTTRVARSANRSICL